MLCGVLAAAAALHAPLMHNGAASAYRAPPMALSMQERFSLGDLTERFLGPEQAAQLTATDRAERLLRLAEEYDQTVQMLHTQASEAHAVAMNAVATSNRALEACELAEKLYEATKAQQVPGSMASMVEAVAAADAEKTQSAKIATAAANEAKLALAIAAKAQVECETAASVARDLRDASQAALLMMPDSPRAQRTLSKPEAAWRMWSP